MNEQRTTQEERTSREKREGNKKGKTILDHLIPRSRAESKRSIDILNKRRRNEEEDRIEAKREFLRKFEKARKITRSPLGRKTHYKEEKRSMTETEGDAKEEQKYDGRIHKNNKQIYERHQRRIEKCNRRNKKELEETRERRERRNNIVIKRWMPKRESLEAAVKEMLKNERANMITVKIKGKDQRREIMIKEKNLKGKNIFIDNDLTWKERQVQKEIRMIAEAEKETGAKVKISYRKLKLMKKSLYGKGRRG
ncbi:hypothetical protein P5V15_011655 [Pogonomyrmex californicus]